MKESPNTVAVIEVEDIGPVSFIKKQGTRSLKITMKPFKGIQVTIPWYVSLEKAGKFVLEKKEWIKKGRIKMATYESKITRFEDSTAFHTRQRSLSLEKHSKATIKTEIGRNFIKIFYPEFAEISDPRIQRCIRNAVDKAWLMEAKEFIPDRVSFLALKHNLNYRQLSFRNNKSRWGSCSRDNKISLNTQLIRLPQHLCDYVILHELSHTIHKHHQLSFWKFLDSLTEGNAKKLDKELNDYSPNIW